MTYLNKIAKISDNGKIKPYYYNYKKLDQKLEIIVKELTLITKILIKNDVLEKKAVRKRVRINREHLMKIQPITPKIYQLLIENVEDFNYTSVRLRIAICLLTLTGIQINELLILKVNHLPSLLNTKMLTVEGKKILKNREEDFRFFFLIKNLDSYIFTSESNHNKIICRETMTKDLNKVMHCVSKSLYDQSNILTSYSFRSGYISKLWKSVEDLKSVQSEIRCIKQSLSSILE